MHVLDLPATLRDELFTHSPGPIVPVVTVETLVKKNTGLNPDGTWSFGGPFTSEMWDITDRINVKGKITLTSSKPVLPLDGSENIIKAGRVVLQIINTDTHFAVEQEGGIISGPGIESGTVNIIASLNHDRPGASLLGPILLPMFRGKIYSRPEEKFGETVLEVRDELWDVVKKPITYEQFGPNQRTYFSAGTLVSTSEAVAGVDYYAGVSVWGPNATKLTSVINQGSDVIEVGEIVVKNGAKLGKYRIDFQDGGAFIITYPDNLQFTGTTTANFTSQFIDIPASSWFVATNPIGKRIEFFVYKTMSGNPVDIILNELEKAFKGNYGSAPSAPGVLPIDYSSFNAARSYFSGTTVYVSETNKNNTVWLKRKGKKPLNTLQMCQKVADHIMSQIVIDNFGNISLKSPFRGPNETIHELTDSDGIMAASFLPVRATNFYKFQYGWNDMSETYSSFIPKDERVDPLTDEIEEVVIYLPYYKSGVNDAEASNIAEAMMTRILRSFTRISLKVKPQFALPMKAGDRIKVKTESYPIMELTVEIYDANVDLGGVGVFKAVKIPDIIEEPTTFCEGQFCIDTFC